jgi:hypothetical protein
VHFKLFDTLTIRPAGSTLDIKHSSYKKLSNFLDVLQTRGILVVKETGKVCIYATRFESR